MTRKGGLGRGLEALIPAAQFEPQSPAPADAGGVLQVAVGLIDPNPRQPRSHFDAAELAGLADSIREHGVLQPLILTTGDQTGRYQLVAGERRLLAARQAGLASVPALVRETSDQQRLELALIENVQRADLGPLETAEAYRQLAEEFGLSHEAIAARVGKQRVTVTNTLRLLRLAPAAAQALYDGRISEGHARALLALNSPQAQEAALHTVEQKDLSVRQTEALVRQLAGERPPAATRPAQQPEVAALEQRLQAALGTRINLRRGKKGGTLVIHYYSEEELNALAERLLGEANEG